MRWNTEERWGSVAIGLHWLVAGLILLVQVPAGLVMLRLDPGLLQDTLFNVHKNVGLVIFALALVRVGWRLANPVPALPLEVPGWQVRVAHLTHFLLYALIFLLPISGFLYTAFGGFPVPLLMVWDLGRLIPASEPQAEIWQAIHYWSQWALYGVVALHVAGALQHHLVHDDDVLRRMLRSR
jgi:cytochrome b561